MATDFKRGDHVEWNSEAGRVRGTIQKKVTRGDRLQGLQAARLEGGAAVHHQERQDRPPGHPQGVGPQEGQEGQPLAQGAPATASVPGRAMPDVPASSYQAGQPPRLAASTE